MTDPRSSASLSPTFAEANERPADDLIERWRRGERTPAEAYLLRFPDLSEDSAFELVLTEVVLRQEAGEPPSLEEFLWRFPRFEERLRRHFDLYSSLAASPDSRQSSTSPHVTSPPIASQHAGATKSRSSRPREPLPSVPGYETLEEIARGGMGVVYRARDEMLGREVALKFLPKEFAGDRERSARFLREARTASALNHPNICTVHALGDNDGRIFIVMELVEGVTLHELAGSRPDFREIARMLRQVVRALAAAHEAGVVHRDIKPENIMVRDDGYVKVLDFGLARQLPQFAGPKTNDASGRETGGESASGDTTPGAILGTASYMSPEQARGETAASPADIFSLGVILYQLATGRRPFEAGSMVEILQAIATAHPAPPSRLEPRIPLALEELTLAMLHKDPRLRPTADEVEAALGAILAETSPLAVIAANAGGPSAAGNASRAIVRREALHAALEGALERAGLGNGSIVCLSGEPGIGKTTLVEGFLGALAGRPGAMIGVGRCSERQADTQAYLPMLDALQSMLRGEASGSAARLLQLAAPTWYSQLSPASPEAVGDLSVQRASSQPAMLREFAALVQELSRLGVVVLFIDDIHWADPSTVDLLAHLGRDIGRLRLLVIATYRPTELLLGPHPFHRLKLELQGRGVCTELAVGFLSAANVRSYLEMEFAGHAFPEQFAETVHSATEGNPLFMADLLRYLRERGTIVKRDGAWRLARDSPDLMSELPGSVKSMIQRQLELLCESDRLLLAAASILGPQFDSAVVARALALDAAEVEDRLATLDRVHRLVRLVREGELPDKTLSLRYAFVHVLYQQSLYGDLQPSRRAAWAEALAESLAAHYRLAGATDCTTACSGERAGNDCPIAGELACLYEVGRNYLQAARFFHLAAQNAVRLFAHREAIALARRGLRMLASATPSPARDQAELKLQTTLGMQLQVTKGFGAAEAGAAYARARQLCSTSPGAAPGAAQFPVLWGLWLFSKVRSQLDRSQELADELLALSRRLHDPDLALQAHQALAMNAFCRGAPATCVEHVEQTAALYDSHRHTTHAQLFGQDPAVICKAFGAVALWILGYPDQARRQSREAIAMSERLSPSSQAVAMHFAGMLHQLCRDPKQTRACAEASRAISVEHGFSFWKTGADVLDGWSLAASGAVPSGVVQLWRALDDWAAIESVTYRTYFLGLLAESLLATSAASQDNSEARAVVLEALELAEKTGETLVLPELHRLLGMCNAHLPARAESDFRKALELARLQDAKSFELRAATSLARISGGRDDARRELESVLARLTEGFDTPDAIESRQVLLGFDA